MSRMHEKQIGLSAVVTGGIWPIRNTMKLWHTKQPSLPRNGRLRIQRGHLLQQPEVVREKTGTLWPETGSQNARLIHRQCGSHDRHASPTSLLLTVFQGPAALSCSLDVRKAGAKMLPWFLRFYGFVMTMSWLGLLGLPFGTVIWKLIARQYPFFFIGSLESSEAKSQLTLRYLNRIKDSLACFRTTKTAVKSTYFASCRVGGPFMLL